MIGFRGASRYVDPSCADAFAPECKAVRKVRDEMGLDNLWVLIPLVRTLDEGRKVVEVLESNALNTGQHSDGTKARNSITMWSVHANDLKTEEFHEIFDGLSILPNDMHKPPP